MEFQILNDIEIDGVKITNIYRECEYYPRTTGHITFVKETTINC